MLNNNLPGQKFFWKEGFIEQYANQEKDQVLGHTVLTISNRARWEEPSSILALIGLLYAVILEMKK